MLVASISAIAASGTDVAVLTTNLRGRGPCRLYIKNSGSNALTACKVQMGADTTHYVTIDSTTFATLAGSALAVLVIAAPVDLVRVLATCAAGTTLDIQLTSADAF